MRRWLLIFILFIKSGVLFASSIKTIHFATEATYAPFEYINETGQLVGFDIDIAKALCKQLKASCTFSNQSFNSLIPSLKLGKFDAVIAAVGVTAERKKEVDFTVAYYEPSASFVAPIHQYQSLAQLNGKVVGVQQGTLFAKYLRDKYGKNMQIKTYASAQDALLDLILQRTNVVLTDTPIASTWIRQNKNSQRYAIVDHPIVDHEYFGAGYGIAVKKNNIALLKALNDALIAIKANGTYDKIVKKYLGG